MKVIAEGCPMCEPLVDPERSPQTESHASANYAQPPGLQCLVDGDEAFDVAEAWAGAPGRVIRYELAGEIRLCPCRPSVGHGLEPALMPFRQLIEYDLVELRRVSP